MADRQSREAWGEFWAQGASRAGQANGGGGCLPQRWAAIEQAQSGAWLRFIEPLAKGASVLDLATGDARVLRWMRAARPDLVLEGIDLAPTLPAPPEGIRTRGGIAMEELPFETGTFDAVVSQFGFEYGDVKTVAGEIARVLAEGGCAGLMVHRGDGPILAHNLARRSELLWALKEKAAARKTKAAVQSGPAGIDKAARLAEKLAQQGAARFGQQSPAWEIAEAIRRSCLMGRRAGAASIVQTIESIEAQAKNELGRIKSLGSACATADGRASIVEAFADNGLALEATHELKEPGGRAFADFLLIA